MVGKFNGLGKDLYDINGLAYIFHVKISSQKCNN